MGTHYDYLDSKNHYSPHINVGVHEHYMIYVADHLFFQIFKQSIGVILWHNLNNNHDQD